MEVFDAVGYGQDAVNVIDQPMINLAVQPQAPEWAQGMPMDEIDKLWFDKAIAEIGAGRPRQALATAFNAGQQANFARLRQWHPAVFNGQETLLMMDGLGIDRLRAEAQHIGAQDIPGVDNIDSLAVAVYRHLAWIAENMELDADEKALLAVRLFAEGAKLIRNKRPRPPERPARTAQRIAERGVPMEDALAFATAGSRPITAYFKP